jgi:hypothetical protein
MKHPSTLILQSGINDLIKENDSAFKKSLINSLSLKLNEAIKEVETEFKSKIMLSSDNTDFSTEIKEFINFVENYDSKLKNKLKLKNGTFININENDFKNLKEMFDTLNNKNKNIFVKEITESPAKLKDNLDFYKKAQRVLK